jgi:hypothetical protein
MLFLYKGIQRLALLTLLLLLVAGSRTLMVTLLRLSF